MLTKTATHITHLGRHYNPFGFVIDHRGDHGKITQIALNPIDKQ